MATTTAFWHDLSPAIASSFAGYLRTKEPGIPIENCAMDDLQLTRKLFFKKTRKGKVVQPVQEKYLHADLECGYMSGASVTRSKLSELVALAPHKQLLVIDTNIAMHQVDVLEYNCPATSTLVVVQTVLQELRHLNHSIYLRIMELIKDSSRSYIFYPNELSAQTAIQRFAARVSNSYTQ